MKLEFTLFWLATRRFNQLSYTRILRKAARVPVKMLEVFLVKYVLFNLREGGECRPHYLLKRKRFINHQMQNHIPLGVWIRS